MSFNWNFLSNGQMKVYCHKSCMKKNVSSLEQLKVTGSLMFVRIVQHPFFVGVVCKEGTIKWPYYEGGLKRFASTFMTEK